MVMRLKELLGAVLSGNDLQLLVRAYDVVGDIVIMTIPRELETKEHEIASAILANNRKIKVVAKRAAHYGGEFRSRPITIIGGEARKETEVREFGIRLQLNVEKVYFSIRSGNERRRIASLVQPGEKVLVLFSGIGPYPLMISMYSRAKRIIGIEKNPIAHDYGLLNLSLNKKINNIELFQGDVIDILPQFTAEFDRIIMPLPKSAGDFVDLALTVLRPGGCLHFYDMQDTGAFAESVAKVRAASDMASRSLLAAEVVVCGHCGPRTYRICVDALIGAEKSGKGCQELPLNYMLLSGMTKVYRK
jgi:tRNA (guanine37-N1)-methyltransferase